jgi:hypothetical protein
VAAVLPALLILGEFVDSVGVGDGAAQPALELRSTRIRAAGLRR